VRIVSRLTEPDPSNLHAGQEMILKLVELPMEERDVLIYAFAPR
jgi:hypothetical protein